MRLPTNEGDRALCVGVHDSEGVWGGGEWKLINAKDSEVNLLCRPWLTLLFRLEEPDS